MTQSAPMRTPSPSITRPSNTTLTSMNTSLADHQGAAHVEPRRIGQRHARGQQLARRARAALRLELRQLRLVVDAEHLGRRSR